MRAISLKLDEGLDERVASVAARRGVSKSAVIRDALRAYMADQAPGAARPGSALELAGELVGCLQGPGDLSHDPVHLDGFGE